MEKCTWYALDMYIVHNRYVPKHLQTLALVYQNLRTQLGAGLDQVRLARHVRDID